MSDFNTMFEEQVAVQEHNDSTYRILEAMLKRDSLEIEYRQKGVSESEIAEFRKTATRTILEAAENDKKGLKDAYKQGGVKGAAKHIWDKICELFKKLGQWFKKIWLYIRNAFAKDDAFIKRYEPILKAHANDDSFKGIEVKLYDGWKPLSDSDLKVDAPSSGAKADSYDAQYNKIKEAKIEPRNVTLGDGYTITSLIDGWKETSKYLEETKKNADTAEKAAKEAQKKAEASGDEAKAWNGYLKTLRAAGSFQIKVVQARHKAYKSAIIRCVSKVKAVKESTVAFMVEACNNELDAFYKPIFEADENAASGGDEKKKGFGGKAWDKIKALFDKFITWCKKIWITIRNAFAKDENFIKRYKATLTDSKNQEKFVGTEFECPDDFQLVEPTWGTAKSRGEEYINQMLTDVNNREIKAIPHKVGDSGWSVNDIIQKFEAAGKDKSADQANKEAENAKKEGESDKNLVTVASLFAKWLLAWQKLKVKFAQKRHATLKSVLIKCISKSKNVAEKSQQESAIQSFIESGNIEVDYAIESVLIEADEVDDVIDKALDNGMEVDDVNHASTEVLTGDASTDPFALDYEKTNSFSQTVDMGGEGDAGTINAEIGDTTTNVKNGNETPSVKEESAQLRRGFAELASLLGVA